MDLCGIEFYTVGVGAKYYYKGNKMDVTRILEAGENTAKTTLVSCKVQEINIYSEYAERGYDLSDGKFIACGNWNVESHYEDGEYILDDDTIERVANALERIGAVLEWSDEWLQCTDCGNIFRCSPDSYGYQPSGIIDECGAHCIDCLDIPEYLESLENLSNRACNLIGVNPTEHGYTRLDVEFESGMNWGQDASPKLILELLQECGAKRVLFDIDSVGQFGLSFGVYVPDTDIENLVVYNLALETGKTDGPSNAARLSNALKGLKV